MPAVPGARAEHDGDRQFTSTLASGLALLACFRGGEPMLAHRELVARTGFAKANVSRLAFTLVQLGFLRRDEASGKYRLGSPVLSLGYPLFASMHIRQIARPYMRELAAASGGAVAIGIRDRSRMIYVETTRSATFGAEPSDIGTTRPLLGSAMGSAWLAAAPAFERTRAVNQARLALERDPGPTARGDTAAHARGGAAAARNRGHPAEAVRARGRGHDAVGASGNGAAHALRELGLNGFCTSLDEGLAAFTVAVPMRASVDSELVVFDCTVRRAPSDAAFPPPSLGHRLAWMVRSVEDAMSMRQLSRPAG